MPNIEIRAAVLADLPAIVAMLADDPLGSGRENAAEPLDTRYVAAFEAITADRNQLLAVMADGVEIVGTLQITLIRGLSRKGGVRGNIEAVRVAGSRRGNGLGRRLIEWAIDACRRQGCDLVQLTTDRSRIDAHRFYEGLGFKATHIGYKLLL